jgi:diguanylate cyclase (GGDEF)-like protein
MSRSTPTPSPTAVESDRAADARGQITSGDCNALFDAVLERLRQIVQQSAAAAPDCRDSALRDGIRECTEALAQVHSAMAAELARRSRFESELARARSELEQTRRDLACTRTDERRQRHRAQHDELTSLPNRAHFHARLDRALATGAWSAQAPESAQYPAMALLYVDLDGFKAINDSHGHAAGDALLRIVAARLRRAMRAEDMVCRLGGDEFACLLADAMSREQLHALAGKLYAMVAAPVQVGALELHVRPSIGIAVCPQDGHTSAALLERADAAMYLAKRHQVGYAFFDRVAGGP